MGLFELMAALLTLTAVFRWLNHKTIEQPTTIGVILIALAASVLGGCSCAPGPLC